MRGPLLDHTSTIQMEACRHARLSLFQKKKQLRCVGCGCLGWPRLASSCLPCRPFSFSSAEPTPLCLASAVAIELVSFFFFFFFFGGGAGELHISVGSAPIEGSPFSLRLMADAYELGGNGNGTTTAIAGQKARFSIQRRHVPSASQARQDLGWKSW